MAAPTISAAQAIGEYLQSPDDLMKIPAFRKKLEKEKASIDIRLKSGVKEQLAVTSESLRQLFTTRENVQAIRDEMVTVDRMCSDPQNIVSTFDQISRVRPLQLASFEVLINSQVSMVHRNFEQTEEMVNNLLEMNSGLDIIEQMLAADLDDLLGPAPNLLPIHHQLTQLESFRNETLHQAKKASAESRNKLTRRFERLTNVIETFDEYLIELGRNILPLARAGHPEVIVKIIKIAEVEGREDEKVMVIL